MIKPYYILILVLSLSVIGWGCKHGETDTYPIQTDYFDFAYSNSWSGNNKLYRIEAGNVFVLDSFKTPLGALKFNTAQKLILDLPSFLLQHPNQDFLCSGCADQPGIFIRCSIAGTIYQWSIDDVPETIPNELRGYVNEVISISNQM